MALVSLQSCREDFDFHEAYCENPEFVYRESFEKAYGEIDPDENWDFTVNRATRASAAEEASIRYNTDKVFNVPTGSGTVSKWIKDNMNGWGGNSGRGTSFVLTVPDKPFEIIPIYVDKSGSADWILYMCVGNVQIPIFQRTTNWTGLSLDKFYSYKSDGNTITDSYSQNFFNNPNILSFEKLKQYVGLPMYFYLELTEASLGGLYGYKGDKSSSLKNGMIALNLPAGTELGLGDLNKNAIVIGCEDATRNADNDYNDFIFMLATSEEIEILTDPVTEWRIVASRSASKRYMVEDLGATEKTDIDFNDIVIDFEKTVKQKYVWDRNSQNEIDAIPVEPEEITSEVLATVRALGGTKNISVYLSNNTTGVPSEGNDVCIFTKDKYGAADADLTVAYNTSYADGDNNCVVSGNLSGGLTASLMYNTTKYGDREQESLKNTDHHYDVNDYIAKINIAGVESTHQWSPSLNNVYVVVYEDISNPNKLQSVDDSHKTIRFPYAGDVPEMIATPISWDWNWERCGVFPDENGNYKSGSKVRLTKSAQ